MLTSDYVEEKTEAFEMQMSCWYGSLDTGITYPKEARTALSMNVENAHSLCQEDLETDPLINLTQPRVMVQSNWYMKWV